VHDSPLRLLAVYEARYPGAAPQMIVQAPERDMWAAARLNGTARFKICAAEINRRTIFSYQSAKRRQTVFHRPLPRWARYIAGMSVLLDVDTPGIDAVASGAEPAGPRYDYALGLVFAALWLEINGQPIHIDALLDLAERVRREYVGE
jgi:hypothetical protein